jgi:hypothetical protein
MLGVGGGFSIRSPALLFRHNGSALMTDLKLLHRWRHGSGLEEEEFAAALAAGYFR